MNNNFSEQLKKIRETIALTAQEKDVARTAIKRFVETYVPTGSVPSPFMQTTRYFLQPLQVAALSFVILLMSGAGLTYAAQDALPGEALYGIKVNINEGVRAWSINDPRTRAEYEIERAAKRLEETAQLALMGRLDAEAEMEIREHLEKHTDRAQKEAAKMTGSSAAENLEVTTKLASEISARSNVLVDIQTAKNTNGELTAILAAAQETLTEIAETQLATSEEVRADNTEAAEIRANTKLEEAVGQLALLDEKLALASARMQTDLTTMGQELARFDTTLETARIEEQTTVAVMLSEEEIIQDSEPIETTTEETTIEIIETDTAIVAATVENEDPVAVTTPYIIEPALIKKVIDQRNSIEELIRQAEESIENGEFGDAIVTLQETSKRAEEILTEIELQVSYQKDLDPMIRETSSQEEAASTAPTNKRRAAATAKESAELSNSEAAALTTDLSPKN